MAYQKLEPLTVQISIICLIYKHIFYIIDIAIIGSTKFCIYFNKLSHQVFRFWFNPKPINLIPACQHSDILKINPFRDFGMAIALNKFF